MGNKESIRISQVSAGALAAVTAALLGSTMGVAGTVVGAALASVVSTVGGALYLRSIQRTTRSVRTVKAKVVGRSGGATVLVATDDPDDPDDPDGPAPGDEVEAAAEPDDRPPVERRRLRWPMLVVGSLAAFALGMVAVTGVEWLRGEPLSGGTGTTFGSIVDHDGAARQPVDHPVDPATPTTSTTSTTTPSNPTSTTSPDSSTTTSTTPSPSEETTSTPTTTTTTTTTSPPEGTVPPPN